MVNNNNLINLINNKKPVELVKELKDYEIKKSPLSAAARGKVVNKSGSNFLSDKEGYGPCSYSGCSQPSSCRFRLEIRLENCMGGSKGMTVYSVEQAQVASTEIYYSSGY